MRYFVHIIFFWKRPLQAKPPPLSFAGVNCLGSEQHIHWSIQGICREHGPFQIRGPGEHGRQNTGTGAPLLQGQPRETPSRVESSSHHRNCSVLTGRRASLRCHRADRHRRHWVSSAATTKGNRPVLRKGRTSLSFFAVLNLSASEEVSYSRGKKSSWQALRYPL